MRSLVAFALLMLVSQPAFCGEEKLPDWVKTAGPAWVPPADGVVRDKWAAIEIAHAAWFSETHVQPVASLDLWQKTMDATLKDGVWEVTAPMKEGIGGSLFIFVAQRDGRIVGMVLTQ